MVDPEPPQYVKLISADGFEFVVDKRAACVSNFIKNMLSSEGAFNESLQGTVSFPQIPTAVLEMVVKFMLYKWKQLCRPQEPAPEFKIPPEIALQLLMAADYLDV